MKSSSLIIAVTLLLAAIIDNVKSEPGCKAMVSDVMKFQMTQIGVCTKQLGYKGKEKSEKMNCIMKCVLVSTGSLLEDGTISVETGFKFILSSFPTDYIGKALIQSAKCQELASSLDNSPADPKCKSYEPFVKCLTTFIMGICNS